jgi:hypothetical protein
MTQSKRDTHRVGPSVLTQQRTAKFVGRAHAQELIRSNGSTPHKLFLAVLAAVLLAVAGMGVSDNGLMVTCLTPN